MNHLVRRANLRFSAFRLIAGLILVVAVVACGADRTYTSVASSTAQNSPSSTSAGYKLYVSPTWLYSVEYPGSWYDLPLMQGAELETQKSFSNDSTGSPEGMHSDGVFLTIWIDSQPSRPCSQGPGANDPRISTTQLSIDGETTTEYLFVNGSVGAVVSHHSWCYRFSFLTLSTETRDKYGAEIAHMLSSFKFNR